MLKDNFGPKSFGSEKVLGQKKTGSPQTWDFHNFGIQTNLGHKQIWGPKTLGSHKFWGLQNFGLK